ncbi:MAG: hypothetical protein NC124_02295 [Clostridium sp.]|nr:hypothetical protein [Clostridium sp.]
MTNLPTKDSIIDPEVNTGVWKTLYGDIRDFITQLPGGAVAENISISNNTFTPTSCFVSLSPEGKESSDIVETIRLTNMPDGSVLFLSVQKNDVNIRIRHSWGGQGSIFLFQNQDVILTSNFTIMLLRVGSFWQQVNTSGYIFGQDGLINNDLLSKATSGIYGLARFATQEEYDAGTAEDVIVTPKQVAETVSSLKTTINTKIYPVTIYQKTKAVGDTIALEDDIPMYLYTVRGGVAFKFDKGALKPVSDCYTFQLLLDMQVVSSISFPGNVSWLNGEAPDVGEQHKYLLVFMTTDNGASWVGNLQGYW